MKVHYTRRPRTGVMLAYPFEEKRLAKWNLPYLVQPKYNGLRCLAAHTPSGVQLLSSTGLPIETVPHIVQAMRELPLGIYDGELYIHNNFQKLISIVNRGNLAGDYREVEYIIFDSKNELPQDARLWYLTNFTFPRGLQAAPVWACSDLEDVESILSEQMQLGYEGVVLREPQTYYKEKRVTTMLKIKPRSSDTYRIVGTLEEVSIHGEPKGALGAFQVVDADGNTFKVGSGLTAEQRRYYWEHQDACLGHLVQVKYQGLTERGVPWFPVFVEVVR